MRLIDTSHLKLWAASRAAQGQLPRVVKLLIQAVARPQKLRMPSGDAVWVPGYDGAVLNADESRFVPLGWSVWEVGTDSDFKDKANGDYDKRSQGKFGSARGTAPNEPTSRSEVS